MSSSSLVDCSKSNTTGNDDNEFDDGSLTICLPEMNEATDVMLSESGAATDLIGEDDVTTEYIEVGESTTKRFNFLVAGANGSGKSTFCVSALNRYFPSFQLQSVSEGPTVQIAERGRCEKKQGKDTRIIVTIVDTPGYGDRMHHNDRVTPVIEYMEQQNRLYEQHEEYRRPNQQENDTRIHCCFYFIMPHRLTPLDLAFLTQLQARAPIVPLVAKRDTINDVELEQQLRWIHHSLQEHSIRVFDFQERAVDESWLTAVDDTKHMTLSLEHTRLPETPFSRIGMSLHEAADKPPTTTIPRPPRRQIRNVFAVISGRREYSWGTADENDTSHSDTPRLHQVLFTDTTLQSLGRLRAQTNAMHDTWRRQEAARQKQLRQTAAQQRAAQATQQRTQVALKRRQQYRLWLKTVACVVGLPWVWWGSRRVRWYTGATTDLSEVGLLVEAMVLVATVLCLWRTL